METDSESEAAFSVMYDSDSDESDVFGDGDWFDKITMADSEESDWFSEEEVVERISSVPDDDSLDNPHLPDASDDALAAPVVANSDNRHVTYIRAELYDSGCTKHISPY